MSFTDISFFGVSFFGSSHVVFWEFLKIHFSPNNVEHRSISISMGSWKLCRLPRIESGIGYTADEGDNTLHGKWPQMTAFGWEKMEKKTDLKNKDIMIFMKLLN